jgi:hypothetical protein
MPEKNCIVKFTPSGRGKAQCPPNPAFPNGLTVNLAQEGQPSCTFILPYPAPECGHFLVSCTKCPRRLAVTAAGRADDPVSITIPCTQKIRSN